MVKCNRFDVFFSQILSCFFGGIGIIHKSFHGNALDKIFLWGYNGDNV